MRQKILFGLVLFALLSGVAVVVATTPPWAPPPPPTAPTYERNAGDGQWTARGPAVHDTALIDSAARALLTPGEKPQGWLLLWAEPEQVVFALPSETQPGKYRVNIVQRVHQESWFDSSGDTFDLDDPAVTLDIGSRTGVDLFPRTLLATDVTAVDKYSRDEDGRVDLDLGNVENGVFTGWTGSSHCAPDLLVFHRGYGADKKTFLGPWGSAVNQGAISRRSFSGVGADVRVDDLIALGAAVNANPCHANRTTSFPASLYRTTGIRLLADAVRIGGGPPGRLLAVSGATSGGQPAALLWNPARTPEQPAPGTLGMPLPPQTAPVFALGLDKPVTVVLSAGPVTTQPALPVLGKGNGFTAFAAINGPTAVVTTDEQNRPKDAVVLGRQSR
ncbi:hypothetical protein [Amycolatopsis anabasis]|uniref:hypothetical protein n=1 Tax=Amycolatopsis anabasis TaxID=1840409 RepID=UPI00131E0C3B|nr:hypothetical protein [Amycolatopsis anabasis]